MGMTIEDIKHCLLCMIDCEVCEECNLYGTTGTDHCERDCVDGALNIINTYERLRDNYNERLKADMVAMLTEIQLEIEEMSELSTEVHGEEWNEVNVVYSQDVLNLIQQKIDKLKKQTGENTDGCNNK